MKSAVTQKTDAALRNVSMLKWGGGGSLGKKTTFTEPGAVAPAFSLSRRIYRYGLRSALCVAILLAATTAQAQQIHYIEIKNSRDGTGATVYGNSSESDGTKNDLLQINNTITVFEGVKLSGTAHVYGAEGNHMYSNDFAENNTVHFYGHVESSYDDVITGGKHDYGPGAKNNIVNIYESSYVGGTVMGAYSSNNDGNKVNIYGGTITGNVIGAYGYGETAPGGVDSKATNNVVTVRGNPTFGASTILYGVLWDNMANLRIFSDNTLNWHSNGIEVNGVQNFQIVNFYLTEGVKNNDTLLIATGTVDILGANITLSFADNDAGTALKLGDKIILIDAGTLTQNIVPFKATGGEPGAKIMEYEFEVSVEDTTLVAKLTKLELRPDPDPDPDDDKNKILSENYLAGVMLLHQTGDMLEQRVRQHQCGWFADIAGGRSRYNTGSHVDITGFSLATGLIRCANTMPGKITYGAFFEYGNGSDIGLYAVGVRGSGKIDHYGGGVLARQNFGQAFYADGLVRVGGIDSRFYSGDLDGVRYDSSSVYVGTQFGLGTVRKLSSRNTLDLYGKYFYTYQGGDNVTLSTNELVKFDSIDSHRLRLGGRSNYVVNRRVSTYWGAAWDYEFDGVARASASGFAIAAPSLRGGTGMGELGLSVSGSAFSGRTRAAPSIDLGVQGYVGKREGVAGTLQVRWAW